MEKTKSMPTDITIPFVQPHPASLNSVDLEEESEPIQSLLEDAIDAEASAEQWQAVRLYHQALGLIRLRAAELDSDTWSSPSSKSEDGPRSRSPRSPARFVSGQWMEQNLEGVAQGLKTNLGGAEAALEYVQRAEQLAFEDNARGCSACYREATKALELQLRRIMEDGIVEERNLLMFTDTLVALAWPMATASPDHFVKQQRASLGQRLLDKLRSSVHNMVRLEWSLRVAIAEAVCVFIVLQSHSDLLRHNPWACVLVVVCVKPTLGDAVHTAWDVLSGGIFGFLLCLPTFWMSLFDSNMYVFAALACIFFVILFTCGDTVQARFALLVPLCGIWQQSTSIGDSEPEALKSAITTICGYALGASLGVLALLLPFPRLVMPQLCWRLAEGFQFASRLHAVLVVASQQREAPIVLHRRAAAILQKLTSCVETVERLLVIARWEPRSLKKWSALRCQYALLQRLTWNLQLRFDRRLVRHTTFQQRAAAVQREPLHAGVRAAISCMKTLAEAPPGQRPGHEFRRAYKVLVEAMEAQSLPPSDLSGAPLGENAAAYELDFLRIRFDHELSDYLQNAIRHRISRKNDEAEAVKKVWSAIKHLFPGMFVHDTYDRPYPEAPAFSVWNLRNLPHLATRLREAAAVTSALLLSCSPAWFTQDSLPALASQDEIFCPIAVIFTFQSRWHNLLRSKSRVWRWMIGTYLGCTFAWWSMTIADGQAWVLALCHGFAAFVGTWLHASEFIGFGGLVAAFTTPVICIPIFDEAQHVFHRSTARLVQSITGIVCVLGCRMLIQPLSSEELLRKRLAASLSGIIVAVQELVWPDSTDLGSPKTVGGQKDEGHQWQERQKRLMPEVTDQRHLLEEALEEPSFGKTPSGTDLQRALEAINTMWHCILQIESMIATFGKSSEAATLLAQGGAQFKDLMAYAMQTAEHMRKILLGAEAKIPPSLFQLLGVARALEDFRATATSPPSGIKPESNNQTSPVRRSSNGKDEFGMSLGNRVSLERRSSKAQLEPRQRRPSLNNPERRPSLNTGQGKPVLAVHDSEVLHDVMVLGALLGRVQLLSEHTAEMAWRTVSLVQKQRPSAAGAGEHADLYDFDIAV